MATQTKTTWHRVRLGEIADVLPGFAFKSSEFRKDSGIPVIKIKNITDDYNVSIENSEYLDDSALNKKTKKYLVGFGDMLVAMTGATAGKVGKFRLRTQALLNQRVAKIIPQKVNPDFLWILLGNQDTVGMLYRLADGAAQPNMSGGQIENIEFTIPKSEAEQGRIADVVVTYDDLIENNTRRIKILEEIAQAIYKEWFVYFRFPRLRRGFGGQAGHEKAKSRSERSSATGIKMIDSKTEFGKIPVGWEIKSLGEVAENYDSKRRPISKMKREEMRGDIPYYGAAKIIDYVNDHIFDGKYLLMAEDGSVITKSGNPVLQFINEKFWANNHTHILQGVKVSTEYLYLSLAEFPIQGYITGVAQPKINQENLNRIPVLVSENKVAQIFNSLVEPIFADIWKLKESVNTLQKARDLLLPKLVIGEIKV